jgi:hypothetical protein
VLIATAYVWFAIHFLNGHRYQINPDGVGYLSVAQHYLAGHFFDAINAYWSPLYSWLLVPLLAARIEPLLASKILGMSIGLAALIAIARFATAARFPRAVRGMTCLASIPMLVYAAFAVITPDSLVAAVIVFYLASLARPERSLRWATGIRLGIWMGMAYLAKAYALPLVVGHFLLVRAIELLAGGPPGYRWRTCGSSLITLMTLAAIVGAWGGALKHKYGYFMVGSSGRYNLKLDGPNSPHQVMYTAGLMPPPNATAINMWEDVTYNAWRVPAWNPFEPRNREFLRNHLIDNFWRVQKEFEWITPWAYPILLLLALVAGSRADLLPRRPGLILLAATVLYPLGYCVLHIERRFMYPLALTMLLGAGYTVSQAAKRRLLAGWWRPALAMAVIGGTIYAAPTDALVRSNEIDQPLMTKLHAVRGLLPPGATMAAQGDWSYALYLAFDSRLRYFGIPRTEQTASQIKADLDRFGVDYFLVWGRPRRWTPRPGWVEINKDPHRGFRIYHREPAAPARRAER